MYFKTVIKYFIMNSIAGRSSWLLLHWVLHISSEVFRWIINQPWLYGNLLTWVIYNGSQGSYVLASCRRGFVAKAIKCVNKPIGNWLSQRMIYSFIQCIFKKEKFSWEEAGVSARLPQDLALNGMTMITFQVLHYIFDITEVLLLIYIWYDWPVRCFIYLKRWN